MKRFDVALLIGLLTSILLTSFTSFARECDEIRHNVVRLHILANSDSEQDQALKLSVRDAILEETADLFRTPQTLEQAEELVASNLDEIANIARRELQRQGYDNTVRVGMVNRYFETRVYDGFTMPAGRYDAVQVEIGSGQGKNWWCVMFPPMCIPAASEQTNLPLEDRIQQLGSPSHYKPAFAVVEAIESVRNYWSPSAQVSAA